jgi:nucleoside-diphosphate-sugar epimerase
VRALVRAESDTRHLERIGCDLVLGDLEEPRGFRGAADGCPTAVHAAALVAAREPWDRYRRVNVEGTRHAVTECLRGGVDRFVHLSSVAVYGHPRDHGPTGIDETSPTDRPVPETAHYGRSKRAAEEVVRSIAGGEMDWVLLRPCVVMGERDRTFTPRVARLARQPLIPLVGGGGNDLALVYAGSVAEAAWLAAGRSGAANRAFNVTDDGELTQRRLLEMARDGAAGAGPTTLGPGGGRPVGGGGI